MIENQDQEPSKANLPPHWDDRVIAIKAVQARILEPRNVERGAIALWQQLAPRKIGSMWDSESPQVKQLFRRAFRDSIAKAMPPVPD